MNFVELTAYDNVYESNFYSFIAHYIYSSCLSHLCLEFSSHPNFSFNFSNSHETSTLSIKKRVGLVLALYHCRDSCRGFTCKSWSSVEIHHTTLLGCANSNGFFLGFAWNYFPKALPELNKKLTQILLHVSVMFSQSFGQIDFSIRMQII